MLRASVSDALASQRENTSSAHGAPVRRWERWSLPGLRTGKAKADRSLMLRWSSSLAYLVNSRQIKDSMSKKQGDSLGGMAGKLAFCLPHARSLKYVCACTQPHTQTPKSKHELILLNCPLYFNHPCTFRGRSVQHCFRAQCPGLCLRVSWEEKVGLTSPCRIPHLPCPALCPSVILIPGAQGPAPTPTQSKPQGAKVTCL